MEALVQVFTTITIRSALPRKDRHSTSQSHNSNNYYNGSTQYETGTPHTQSTTRTRHTGLASQPHISPQLGKLTGQAREKNYGRPLTSNQSQWEITITSISEDKFGWITDDQACKPEHNSLCHIPRDIHLKPVRNMSKGLDITCTGESDTQLTHLEEDIFAITNPPRTIQVVEEKARGTRVTRAKTLPALVHGYLTIKVPCDQAAIISPDQIITSLFPCDAAWTKRLTIQAIIPEVWTNNTDEVTEVIQNNELTYYDKMKILLTKG
ncbi:hypothetical protein WDU94_009734 [Cyamophila willieti]